MTLPPPRATRTTPSTAIANLAQVGTPIYVKLVMSFRKRIETGEWAVDQQIPSLDELAREEGVARATIRHAIGFLESEGLIGRYRGRGTFVLRRPQSGVFYDIPTSWDTLVNHVPDIQIEWLESSTVMRPQSINHHGGSLSSDGYQHLRRLQKHNQIPYFVGDSYVERTIFRAIGKRAFNSPVPMQLIQNHAGDRIGRAEQTIQASNADFEVAQLLDVPVNTAIMVVTRSVFDKDEVLVYESQGLFRSDFVRVHMRLK
ncbi:GntR family transcriptional regulator [Pigmentiphaga sp. GD03639]|jgi:GntR family transcriptional regulator|uniref:GntR family transcriptional regulator n=1 Tax=Pigmentiphaga daeguensis TaxID=414049 RepID=A0ABP3MDN3_9BURK|nr:MULTISPECIES: GntR family transcriptional regulator [unclassified Pigmentiphaga]MDH2237185.1 GntR family transcriptional regulator [Pigmentiphaga sp. GD03639]OVZ61023.1 hypothetical protein CDO46_20260 [Pigmentiphaga sp. NML030171]